jgi:hypothetical protein
MKRYMVLLGILFFAYGVTFIIAPNAASVVGSGIPTLQGSGDEVFGLAFISVGIADILAAYVRYNPHFPWFNGHHQRPVRLRLIVLGATLTLTCAWVTTMILATLFYSVAPGGIFLWGYILYAQTQAIGYHDISPETERQLIEMMRAHMQPPDRSG